MKKAGGSKPFPPFFFSFNKKSSELLIPTEIAPIIIKLDESIGMPWAVRHPTDNLLCSSSSSGLALK
jgi:hypothetical protein